MDGHDLHSRITVDAGKRAGKPCIRSLRITVGEVLGLLASGMNRDAILADYPDLEPADFDAALRYAADKLDHSDAAE